MAPKPPQVSVIVPVYAGQRTLTNLIKRCSAIRETHGGDCASILHEIIFVCDEPIDSSESLLIAAAKENKWIRVISLARNSGQHLATAIGILHSSGDWVMTIDEDLQHPPEAMHHILLSALDQGLDLLYVQSKIRVHGSSLYRDFSSKTSKLCMSLVSRDDYSIISSFRLIRGEVARSIAMSVDKYSYLDAVLFSATSTKRRCVSYLELNDPRRRKESGYDIKKLIRHYGRLIISAEFSSLRVLIAITVIIGMPLLVLLIIMVVIGGITETRQISPGWLSLFFLGVTTNLFLWAYAIYSLKLMSVLFLRSNGSPAFLVINRELDEEHAAYLRMDCKTAHENI